LHSDSSSAGASRTFIDRVRLGHVTDFLDLVAWPAFNLADTFIVVGVAILFGALVLADRPHRMHGARAWRRFVSASLSAGGLAPRPRLAERTRVGTRSLAERLLRDGAVTVDGGREPKSHRLERGLRGRGQLPGRAPRPRAEPATVPLVLRGRAPRRRRQARRA
jgi:hypothetical protein